MRAHWIRDLEIVDQYILREEDLHRLVNVVRIEKDESLLLLNGKGLMIETEVMSISKRELVLKRISHQFSERAYTFDLALGMPKREALELCLKEATELGFRNIYLIKSEFSQMRFPENDRMDKILVSALEQSNAPFLPQIICAEWNTIPWGEYQRLLLLDSQTKKLTLKASFKSHGEQLLIVGPEGGFSEKEKVYLHSLSNVEIVNLPTPILRSPTAVATGTGILIESLLK